eukprot:CAMPEP_0176062908 /NCGR_PEP_ID=MMETSP0120_2-20121206/31372_1 /TAXON_ID=160619 /ORGANISM="Kryptoperidinium foliaceum, Strain CCMP 1326" /LENGTH=439 /DNA_ID=CAMNT_0017396477 /DNA_START=46 /DNA_END=1362 /DNA_ORIENTATION=-
MRFTPVVLSSLALSIGIDAFQPVHIPRQVSRLSASKNLHEFDYLLGETGQLQNGQQRVVSRRRIHLNDDRSTVLASTTFAQPGTEEETLVDEADPYAEIGLEEATPQLEKIQEDRSFSQRVEAKLKTMDLQDIVSTLVIPSIALFAGGRWVYNRAANRVGDSIDDQLDSFASEMIYHDGDFEEMKLCHSDYSKKLVVLGPRKTQAMLKRYLQLYAKKRTVSPQSISSLSYVFSLFKLSEEKTAQILVSLCRDMGDEKISSAGKLLFFGSRILKSPEGKAALEPIRDMIKATYREATVAETMVETSQQAMAEAAYRTAVISGGKGQTSLTPGWQVLGLDKETATRIYEDEAKEGFLSDREKMYGGQSQKYDAKGRPIDKEGKLVDPEDEKAAAEEAKKEEEPASNVYECTECGYTLFIAKGREFKFYGDDFKCPECGAEK